MSLKIPGYKIIRPLAQGGMSSVYLAVQESLDRPVVLKLLKKFDDVYHSARFVNEGRIIASLSHRNIITIYDIGVIGERHYLSMEYLEGGNLEDRILEGISPAAALELLEVIGGCLDFVHRKGIIHRDIKPANILFHSDGTPILTDFGVAKQNATDSRLTKDGTALGSPYYISPEQAENRKVDGRADIYSLGIILHEMLTGKKPFQGDSDIQIIISHLSDPVPSLPPGLQQFQELLDRMIAKDPDARFASAGEMIAWISRFREQAHRRSGRTNPADTLGTVPAGGHTGNALPGNACNRLSELRLDSGGVRIAGLMSVLLLVALVALKATPALTAKAGRLLEGGDAVMPVSMPVAQSRNAATADHNAYLSRAKQALRKLRYTKPDKDNAYYYYRMALSESPGNEEALQGIAEIAEIHADLVEWALGLHQYKKAREYLDTGLAIDPDNARLKQLAARDTLK